MNKIWYILIVFCFLGGQLKAQNIAKLKQKQERAKKELAYTNKILKSVASKQNNTLSRLRALQEDIKNREKSLRIYQEQVASYQKEIDKGTAKAKQLNAKQDKLKKVYGELLQSAYWNSGRFDKWLYIFSAEDFLQAYNRYKYYEQFTSYTKGQLTKLQRLKDSVIVVTDKIKKLKSQKEHLASEEQQAKQHLAAQKKAEQKEIRRLKQKDSQLRKLLKQQQRVERRLGRRIQNLIAKAARKAAKKPISKSDVKLGNSFAQNKGKLPWPAKGFISSAFGEHRHPILPKVKIRNDGIDITAQSGSKCKAVFKGRVSQIVSIRGLNSTVIVKHGSYMTVYANLENVQVRAGQNIKTGQILGKISKKKDGATILKFQIWKKTKRQNPKSWLRRK